MKGCYRDLHDTHMIDAPVNPQTGHPFTPSRQLCATWAVSAWERVPETLVVSFVIVMCSTKASVGSHCMLILHNDCIVAHVYWLSKFTHVEKHAQCVNIPPFR